MAKEKEFYLIYSQHWVDQKNSSKGNEAANTLSSTKL